MPLKSADQQKKLTSINVIEYPATLYQLLMIMNK